MLRVILFHFIYRFTMSFNSSRAAPWLHQIRPRRIARSRNEGRIIRLKLTLNHPLPPNPDRRRGSWNGRSNAIEKEREIAISLPDIRRRNDQSWGSTFFLVLRRGRRSLDRFTSPLKIAKSLRGLSRNRGASSRRGNGCLPVTWQCPPSYCAPGCRKWRSSSLLVEIVENCFSGKKKRGGLNENSARAPDAPAWKNLV